ncbi:MAG: type II secretion system F family protein, partial [Candidatus Bathyarchaeia archaeon]
MQAFRKLRLSQTIKDSRRVNDEELLLFTESCRDLYEAGIPVNQILRTLERSTPNRAFSAAIGSMALDVEDGKTLSEAMARYPGVFGEDYRSLISAAEKSGNWTRKHEKNGEVREGILDMLATYIKRRSLARERVISGLMYPALICCALLVTIAAFAFYILPALRQIFVQIGSGQTGILTTFLLSCGAFVERYWWAVPPASLVAGASVWGYASSEDGKDLWMRLQLRVKPISKIFINLNLGEAMWLMGTLFSAGLTPQEVLAILVESSRNHEIARALTQAREYLYEGISFCDALRKSHWLFDGHTYLVISSAQKNGKLGTSLQCYSVQLFEKVAQSIDR